MQLRKLLFILVLLFPFTRAFAATFVVTSNADSGPGTLRDAIDQAIAADINESKTITFNLTDTSISGRTITLITQFPHLPSNLTIDASTQAGHSFGLSDARVELLFNVGNMVPDTGFNIISKENISILGLYLRNGNTDNISTQHKILGIYMQNSVNIQLGDAGKGNVIYGFAYSIFVNTGYTFTMKDTFCDVDVDGETLAKNLVYYYGIYIIDVFDTLNIGGTTAAEGNLIAGIVYIYESNGYNLPATTINVLNNKLNTDYYMVKSLVNNSYLHIEASQYGEDNTVNVEDNVVSGYIFEENIANNATFLRNYINVDRTKTHDLSPAGNNSGIVISGSKGAVTIGSLTNTADGNVIAYCKPLTLDTTNQVSFNRNSLFCTTDLNNMYSGSEYSPIPQVFSVNALAGGLTGYATSNAIVELYYTDRCQTCSPETYIATVQADGSGKWVYSGPVTGNVIASATLNGSTSKFTSNNLIDDSEAEVISPGCSPTGLGSITGIKVFGTVQVQWTNANNVVIGTTLDLIGVQPGNYTLTVSNGGCNTTQKVYTILPSVPPTQYPAYPSVIKHPCSGTTTGSISITADTLVRAYRWANSSGDTVGSAAGLDSIAAGNYTLYLTNKYGCSSFYKTFTVNEIPLLTIDQTNAQIINDQCNTNNGSIAGLQVNGGIVPYTYRWLNAAGDTIAATPGLDSLSAGNYTLIVNDSSDCGTQSVTFNIQNVEISPPAPSVSNVQLCSSGTAMLAVNNASQTTIYNLYDSSTASQPADQEKGGKFNVTVTNTTSYFITQINGSCESSRAQVNVSVGLSALGIANAFTPNGDGINDYWKINNIENYPQALVQIFTRYGDKIFESRGYSIPFDGTYKGQQLPAGVYYFIINLNSNCSLLSGSLTIIR